MIVSLVGNNPVRIAEEIAKLRKKNTADIERFDGEALSESSLFSVVSGATLFADSRFVIIKNLSLNTKVWDMLIAQASRVSPDTTVVLVDDKLDKRTKSYKELQKVTKSIDASPLTEKHHNDALEWVRQQARKNNVSLSPKQVDNIVRRAYVPAERGYTIDQRKLMVVLKSMQGLDAITDDMIDTLMPPAPGESVFELIAIAASGNQPRIAAMMQSMKLTDDPHRVFALLSSQWAQLVMLSVGQGAATTPIASELGIHPYAAQKMLQTARAFTRSQLSAITHRMADLDIAMKRSKVEPWNAVERAVFAIALKK
jgi:DNA polymerase-3 subunit delta